TPAGIRVDSTLPVAGLTASTTLNTALLDGGKKLPGAAFDIQVDPADVASTLVGFGVPASLLAVPGSGARLRGATPGFDRASPDRLLRNGGIEMSARLGVPLLFDDLTFELGISPSSSGFDVHGVASAARIGPIAGVTITDATVKVDVVNGQSTVRITGRADVLGGRASVDGTLNADFTGSLTLTLDSGRTMNVGDAQISGTAALTTTRVNGQLVGSLGVVGSATLPSWLATAAGTASVDAAACIDTTGNIEARFALPALIVGPGGVVRVGRNDNQQALPAGPAACALPAGAPTQPATGPLFAFRVTSAGTVSAVLDGNLTFVAANAAIAGLTVRGSLDGNTGTGSLNVGFAGGSMVLGGFTINGSATLTLGAGPTLSMVVNGTMNVPGLLTNSTVSGTGDQNGITHLNLSVAGLTLPVVAVDSATLSLDRVGAVYQVTAGLQVDIPGVADNLAVNGSFASTGNGSLSISATTLAIRTAQITQGTFSLIKTGSTMTLRASGRFSLFGASLEVVQADLALLPTTINGSLTIRPVGGGVLSLGGWIIGGTLRLAFSGASVTIEIDSGTVTIPGSGTIGMDGSFSVPPSNAASFTLSLPAEGLRLGVAPSPFFATGTFTLSFTNNVGTLAVANGALLWKDGATIIASMVVPALSISTNGAVSASLSTYSATLGNGFSFTVPSLSFLLDPAGLNARLSLGAGSLVIPGLPSLATPAFTITAATTFSQTLVANELDVGVVSLHGTLVFERQSGTFRLQLSNSPFLEIEGLVNVGLPAFTIASDGTFVADAAFPTLGPAGFQIVGAALHIEKTGTELASFAGRITGGRLLVGGAQPIDLPTLDFAAATRFDETFTISSWALGPFLRATSTTVRLRHLSTGVLRLTVENDPSVSAFSGSSLSLTSLTAESDGSLTGSISGRLALFGTQMAQATFTLSRNGDEFRLTLPAANRAAINLGFITVRVSGFAGSNGGFDFSGSAGVSLGVTGFSFSGSLAVQISSFDGIEGSFSGSVCILVCLSETGSLRSDGRVSGTLRFDANGDRDFVDFGDVNAAWRVYLATGGVRVDINSDGDFNDLGDVAIGSTTSGDSADPSMTTPPNITVNANIGPSGTVRVYYNLPTATDGGIALTVTCSPAPGSLFGVGATTVTCRATDRSNNTTTRSFTVTVVANAGAAVPTATNGATVVVVATGFAPNSLVFVTIRSDPAYLGVFQSDENGVVRLEIVVLDGLPPGAHDIIVEGIGPSGGVRQFVQPFIIPGPVTLGPLPSTGTDVAGPLHAGFALVVLGLSLLAATAIRRRPRTTA
ncbi:MAG TPA: HYR domain-containing protein, partial [Acidimicrobiales bacterium]